MKEEITYCPFAKGVECPVARECASLLNHAEKGEYVDRINYRIVAAPLEKMNAQFVEWRDASSVVGSECILRNREALYRTITNDAAMLLMDFAFGVPISPENREGYNKLVLKRY
jgi:hypothetical protein